MVNPLEFLRLEIFLTSNCHHNQQFKNNTVIEMVRIKHRYLLINILFPEDVPKGIKKSDIDLPDLVRFRQPCPKAFNEESLRLLVRSSVQHNFGDYGAACLGASLRGMFYFLAIK
jgi:hypothetical protein